MALLACDQHPEPVVAESWVLNRFSLEVGQSRETEEPGQTCASDFRRGDANGDGGVNLSDALAVVNYLFRNGKPPACPDSADFDDRDDIELTDMILIMNFLFNGVDLSAPPGPFQCGPDPTPDGLAECAYENC